MPIRTNAKQRAFVKGFFSNMNNMSGKVDCLVCFLFLRNLYSFPGEYNGYRGYSTIEVLRQKFHFSS